MQEEAARRVTLVQAFDAADGPLWTREDAQWATRLAVETAPPDAGPERLAEERAAHALQRLLPRAPAAERWLSRSGWRWHWLAYAIGAGFALGLLADVIGRGAHIDVLAPAPWIVIAWNLAIYALLALVAARHAGVSMGWFRRALTALWQRSVGEGPLREASLQWARISATLTACRTAALLHAAAAALGAGMVTGLYLRGLVFDYRAGWSSTFLEPPMVQAILGVLLAPARAATGVGLPDVAGVQAMRLTPAAPLATVSAADWIHLYAATLALFVIVPRVVLAVLAFGSAASKARRVSVPLPLQAWGRLARWRKGGQPPLVQVLPYAQAPGAQAALGLRELLARELGDDLSLKMGDVTAIGDEEAAAARGGQAGTVLRVALAELGATPEDEHHGRFLRAIASAEPAAPLLLVVDEAAWRVRFGSLPGRLDERRSAWQQFALGMGVRCACVNLDRPDQAESVQAMQAALQADAALPAAA